MSVTRPESRSVSRCASSKQRSRRCARMWKSRSPGVDTAVCVAPASGMKRCSRCGRGPPTQSRSHRSEPNPTTQLSSPSGIRNPTERFRPDTSASALRRASSLSVAAIPTRKIAASVNGPRIGCGCCASGGDTDGYVATTARSVAAATRDPAPAPRPHESGRRCQPLSRRRSPSGAGAARRREAPPAASGPPRCVRRRPLRESA